MSSTRTCRTTQMKPPRVDLIADLLEVVGSGIQVNDLRKHCRLAPVAAGKTQFDRQRLLEELVENGVLIVRDRRVFSNRGALGRLLSSSLANGDTAAWQLFEGDGGSKSVEAKFPSELLAQLGLEGELAVISELKRQLSLDLHDQIDHVSLRDDSAGFDIRSPLTTMSSGFSALEVKTSSRPGEDFRFYISRNETLSASSIRNWFLVGVVRSQGVSSLIGHLRYESFAAYLPKDSHSNSRWESASVSVPKRLFEQGLP